MGARIGAVHDGLVGPFEIERLDQRFAHPRISEFFAAGIYEPAPRAGRGFGGERFPFEPALPDAGGGITRRPYPRPTPFTEKRESSGKPPRTDHALSVGFV